LIHREAGLADGLLDRAIDVFQTKFRSLVGLRADLYARDRPAVIRDHSHLDVRATDIHPNKTGAGLRLRTSRGHYSTRTRRERGGPSRGASIPEHSPPTQMRLRTTDGVRGGDGQFDNRLRYARKRRSGAAAFRAAWRDLKS